MDYLILSAGILLIYYFLFLFRIYRGLKILRKKQNKKTVTALAKVSVVVPFRNEEKNLSRLFSSLENQTYPREQFEVILVDDHSNDSSIEKIKSCMGKLDVKLLQLKRDQSGKKRAITLGVLNAAGEIIAGTDADCVHAPGWLESLAGGFDDKTGLVTGPVTLESDGTLAHQMQMLEHAGLSLSGAGLIATGHPVICSGANIAYRKSLFEKINGFDSKNTLTSGDDEQLMHKIYYRERQGVTFLLDKNCLVTTRAESRAGDFLQQRRRWASKSFNYRPQTILLLTPLFLFFACLIVLLIYAVTFPAVYLSAFLVMLLVKTAADYGILSQGVPIYMKKFAAGSLLIAEILHPLYIVFSVFAGVFSGFNWKNRVHKK
ncbi:MAG: glycosyltransferase [Ignavibacteriaceae bacterium]|nr:glycosyltransferase [Ignavibacteriaceae bacterium]